MQARRWQLYSLIVLSAGAALLFMNEVVQPRLHLLVGWKILLGGSLAGGMAVLATVLLGKLGRLK